MNGPDYTVSDIWRKAILSSGAYPEFDHLKPHAFDDLQEHGYPKEENQ